MNCFRQKNRSTLPVRGLKFLKYAAIDDLRSEKIIAFNRQNLSYTERYFDEKFEEYDLTRNIAYSCDDTYSLVSLVSAGLGIGFAPEWDRGPTEPGLRAEGGQGHRLPDRAWRCLE
ncbi:LysR family transcriptional regulator substrate-binding protein [Rhizobium ruizarguesonis]|uniref:LysR family transcriptional regulator substrate-binding protein n=1 Tax=Rhizobium ruizarguesonis TaxID=2081791 RepID=UPI001031B643|nr:hypothetical protein ELH11_38020 [Rhizobium ruizarguesonis]TBD94904.1 hypothetical protein ELH09_38010 [Rhizobium ruizarguesonis]TBE14562.1 hypothetical protein ELH07_38230 [Rhizobium ruizarguesonis]TBE14746.1 hypothetical protein ELH08_38600 [Rhizobium ruizarguesonis]